MDQTVFSTKTSDDKMDKTRRHKNGGRRNIVEQNGINKMNIILFSGETEASPTHTGRLFGETSRKAKKNNHHFIFFKTKFME